MWKLIIAIPQNETESLEYFERNLKPYFESISGAYEKYSNDSTNYIFVSCDLAHKSKARSYVRNCVCDLIINFYKRDYLSANIILPLSDRTALQTFIKALTAFDSGADKEFILKKLKFTQKIVVKSFFNFRLTELKQRWSELCGLANSNAYYLLSKETFNELLRFLVSSLDSKFNEVHILYNEKGYTICDYYLHQLVCEIAEPTSGQSDVLLLNALIDIAPQKIVFHSSLEHYSPILSMLCEIFEDKVSLAKS